MCFVYVDRPLTPPSPLVDKHGHFVNPPPPSLSTWFVHSPLLPHEHVWASTKKPDKLTVLGPTEILRKCGQYQTTHFIVVGVLCCAWHIFFAIYDKTSRCYVLRSLFCPSSAILH